MIVFERRFGLLIAITHDGALDWTLNWEKANNSMADRYFEPTELSITEDGLFIKWGDEHQTNIPPATLRGSCGCAQCVDEITHQRRFGINDVTDPISIEDFLEIGNYAIEVLFSDLHYTGIYPFKQLRGLCQCQQCANKTL